MARVPQPLGLLVLLSIVWATDGPVGAKGQATVAHVKPAVHKIVKGRTGTSTAIANLRKAIGKNGIKIKYPDFTPNNQSTKTTGPSRPKQRTGDAKQISRVISDSKKGIVPQNPDNSSSTSKQIFDHVHDTAGALTKPNKNL